MQLKSKITTSNQKSTKEPQESVLNKSRFLITNDQLNIILIKKIQESKQDLGELWNKLQSPQLSN